MGLDRAGLRILSRSDSLRLLASTEIGRIGITVESLPVVLPVVYIVDDERILFRTLHGSKLSSATDGSVVAFEADGAAGERAGAWSVVVTGVATHINEDRLPDALLVAAARWNTEASHGVAISTEVISGRWSVDAVTSSADVRR
jgi:nitroimidazol reductase NimA-like FMN-containing flavoprotein (pyridoxamine 5'-phosphate oxidase superfamily)